MSSFEHADQEVVGEDSTIIEITKLKGEQLKLIKPDAPSSSLVSPLLELSAVDISESKNSTVVYQGEKKCITNLVV